MALQSASRFAEALADFDRCLVLAPDLAHVSALRATALQAATTYLESGSDTNLTDVNTLCERAELLLRLQRDSDALNCARRAYGSATQGAVNPEALNRVGNLLLRLQCHADALQCYDGVLAQRPGDFAALFNRANVLQQEGQYVAALADYEAVLTVRPGFAEALIEQAHCLLAQGEFAQAWPLFEARWNTEQLHAARLATAAPQWRGETLGEGTCLLLWGEQGLGDCIQFLRYLPLVAQRAKQIVLRLPDSLHALAEESLKAESLDGWRDTCAITIIGNDAPLPPHAAHCPLMSLPLVFGTTLQSIPAHIPYLRAPQARVDAWAVRLGAQSKPRIGLVWAGGQRVLNNPTRDINLEQLVPLLEIDAEWICLQKAMSESDARMLDGMPLLWRFADGMADFAGTAALIEQLDIVVSVDTAVAHLAGALGKPVCLLLRKSGEWRWMHNSDRSPWYPAHRIFRQQNHGEWPPVVQQVADHLRKVLAQHPC
jgi:tetratricopeptide (TPR) repeat protein